MGTSILGTIVGIVTAVGCDDGRCGKALGWKGNVVGAGDWSVEGIEVGSLLEGISEDSIILDGLLLGGAWEGFKVRN